MIFYDQIIGEPSYGAMLLCLAIVRYGSTFDIDPELIRKNLMNQNKSGGGVHSPSIQLTDLASSIQLKDLACFEL